jgi:hypothetical protein
MRITSAGELLVGTDTSTYTTAGRGVIELNGSSDSLMAWRRAGANFFYIHNNPSGIDQWNSANTYIRFGTNNSERMRIFASGGVGIVNTTDPGLGNLSFGPNGNGTLIGEAFPSGNVILRSAIDTVFQTSFGGTTERMRIGAQGGISFSTSGFGTSGQILRSSGSTANPVWINQSAIAAGTASTAVNLSTNQGDWATNGTISAVVGLMAWKNYSNGHVIFDASASTSPSATAVNNTNATNAWVATYPTLMGWNGGSTFGVRVDSARVADSATSATSATNATNATFAGTTVAAVATTSGTDINLSTTIPSNVKVIYVIVDNVSSSSTGRMAIQVGTSGGFVSTGYTSFGAAIATTTVAGSASTFGFPISNTSAASELFFGVGVLSRGSGNNWIWSFPGNRSGASITAAGAVTLAGTLDRIRISVSAGTFDSGAVSLVYF